MIIRDETRPMPVRKGSPKDLDTQLRSHLGYPPEEDDHANM